MNVLVACEFSGIVRDAFIRYGHNAVSCDLIESESILGPHIKGDVRTVLCKQDYDLVIAHPPCTYLCSSGARWWGERKEEQLEAIEFVKYLWNTNSYKLCIENPIGILSNVFRRPSQIIQPWQFGHSETKATCLWLRRLPPLRPTNIVAGTHHSIHRSPPSKDRWKIRSRTFLGIAEAMAAQWGGFCGETYEDAIYYI